MNQKTSKVASSCGMIGVTERGTRQSSLNMHYLLCNYIIRHSCFQWVSLFVIHQVNKFIPHGGCQENELFNMVKHLIARGWPCVVQFNLLLPPQLPHV